MTEVALIMRELNLFILKRFRLVILPCDEHGENHQLLDGIYQLYKRVWAKELKELDGQEEIYSNDFLRHDSLCALLFDDKPVAFFCFSAINPASEIRRGDSWFHAWPENIMKKLGQSYTYALMPQWFGVCPHFRKTNQEIPINLAQVTTEVWAKIILEFGFEAGFGTTRNNRGVNKLVQSVGGQKITSSLDHGVEVDLFLMTPENIKNAQKNFSSAFFQLWEKREIYGKQNDQENSKRAS